jgi:hypothetical protein
MVEFSRKAEGGYGPSGHTRFEPRRRLAEAENVLDRL